SDTVRHMEGTLCDRGMGRPRSASTPAFDIEEATAFVVAELERDVRVAGWRVLVIRASVGHPHLVPKLSPFGRAHPARPLADCLAEERGNVLTLEEALHLANVEVTALAVPQLAAGVDEFTAARRAQAIGHRFSIGDSRPGLAKHNQARWKPCA